MGERYTRLASLPKNQYLAGCPVILESGTLLRGRTSGRTLLRLKLRSLSYYGILAMRLRIGLTDEAGQEQQVDYTYADLAANTDEAFGQDAPIVLPEGDFRQVRITVLSAALADQSVWRNEAAAPLAPLPPQQELETLLGDRVLLEQYRRDTCQEAKFFPNVYEELWLCACGGINSAEAAHCVHCGVALEELKKITRASDLTRENRKFQRRKRRFHRENFQRRKGTAIALAVLVVLVAALLGISRWQRGRTEQTLAPYRDSAFQEFRTQFVRSTGLSEEDGLAFEAVFTDQVIQKGNYTIEGQFLCRIGQYTSHTPFTVTGQVGGTEQEMVLEAEFVTDSQGRRVQMP